MIQDLVNQFQLSLVDRPALVLDNIELVRGMYVRVRLDENWDKQVENLSLNSLEVTKQFDFSSADLDLLGWFKQRDVWCKLVDMQKPVDPKKQVHSNQLFAIWMKSEVFFDTVKLLPNLDRYLSATEPNTIWEKWYQLFGSSKKEKLLSTPYREILLYLNCEARVEYLRKIRIWIHHNISSVVETMKRRNVKPGEYIKIFFDVDDETCQREWVLYTYPKTFLKNQYNMNVAGEIYGVPNLDISLNDKKPYLVHRTMALHAPYLVQIKQAIASQQLGQWVNKAVKLNGNILGYSSGFGQAKTNVAEGYYDVNLFKGEMIELENLPFCRDKFEHIQIANLLNLRNDSDYVIESEQKLREVLNQYFFRGRLKRDFRNDEPLVRAGDFTSSMQAIFLTMRQPLYDWLYKGVETNVTGMFMRLSGQLIEENLLRVDFDGFPGWWIHLQRAWNLRIALIRCLYKKGGKLMADRIKQTLESLRQKTQQQTQPFLDNDDEFYFLSGQLAYYLTSQSKAITKSGQLFEPFLRAKTGTILKKRIDECYQQYKHEILIHYSKFNQAFSMFMGYEPEVQDANLSRDMLLSGLFANNLFYESKGEDK